MTIKAPNHQHFTWKKCFSELQHYYNNHCYNRMKTSIRRSYLHESTWWGWKTSRTRNPPSPRARRRARGWLHRGRPVTGGAAAADDEHVGAAPHQRWPLRMAGRQGGRRAGDPHRCRGGGSGRRGSPDGWRRGGRRHWRRRQRSRRAAISADIQSVEWNSCVQRGKGENVNGECRAFLAKLGTLNGGRRGSKTVARVYNYYCKSVKFNRIYFIYVKILH